MDILEEFNGLGKTPVIAKIGGFRPEDNIKSWFGGNFSLNKTSYWPQHNGKDMIPVIQICSSEVPNGKNYFGDVEIVQVFLDNGNLPARGPQKNGDGWLLLEYKSTDDLIRVQTPTGSEQFKAFQIKWNVNEKKDYPCWEESWNYLDMTEVNDDDELNDRFFEEFDSYTYTKIGGYASYIQSPCGKDYKYIFQISSEEKAKFMVGDNGKLYIFKSKIDGEWYLHWDCY